MTNKVAMVAIAGLYKYQASQEAQNTEKDKEGANDVSLQNSQPKKKGFSLFGYSFKAEATPAEGQVQKTEAVKTNADDVSMQTTQPKKKGISLFGFGFRAEVSQEEQTKQAYKEFKC